MKLRILIDDNQTNGAVFFVENNGRENQITPNKPLYGLEEHEIVAFAKDYVEWVTRGVIDYYEVEYNEES